MAETKKWEVVHDGLSLGMISAPDGRIFRIQELGVYGSRSMWSNAFDSDELSFRIVKALNKT